MNSLVDKLPTIAVIDGKEYPLNTNFREALKAIMAFEDPELTAVEKHSVMMDLLYSKIPDNIAEADKIALQFLNCGDTLLSEVSSEGQGRIYSFQKDGKYIFTAFSQIHGIDLESIEYLHWWKFCYLFMDLSEKCFFSKLIDLRTRRKTGKLTKEEREYCAKHYDIIDLPEDIPPETQEAKDLFLSLLGKNS